MTYPTITVIGGGLVGSLLALQLARRGFPVEVFEKRPDPRKHGFASGRSINLAMAERGLNALRHAGLEAQVLRRAVMMRGRMVHPREGRGELLRYGVNDSEVIWSISRGDLNMLLLDAAEQAGVRVHFEQSLLDTDLLHNQIHLEDPMRCSRNHDIDVLIGADGAGSVLRNAMRSYETLGERIEWLGHHYKELEIPPASQLPPGLKARYDGHDQFAIEPHALHIWPRGGYMCIALPNIEGSFTVTLFMPTHGAHPSFDTVFDAQTAEALYQEDFPDLLPLLPNFRADYDAHSVGSLATVYLDRWHLYGKALLIGDAAHAIVPFHGQGMNCGFEDTVCLARLFAADPHDSDGVFAEFQRQRKPNSDAIAEMALENYIEMRDSVADPYFLAKRELSLRLAEKAPEHFLSRYRMVTFTHLPYAYCLERGAEQDRFLDRLLDGSTDPDQVDLETATQLLRSSFTPLPPLHQDG